jgi:hypothetical protein
MNSKKSTLIAIVLFMMMTGYAQNLNWANLSQDQQHIINVNIGMDYSVNYAIGYGYKLKTALPIIASVEYLQPSGKNLVDDFKVKVGGQIQLYHTGPLFIVAKVYSIFRRYENNYVSMANFGSDLSATVGYFKPKWFAAADVGFDKAIVTHFKHSELFKEHFPDVKDGWYEPATGGNLYYGLQGGISLGRVDIYLKAGKVISQDFKTAPTLPFYGQLGINLKFKAKN